MKITENVYLEKSGQFTKLVEKGLSKPKNGGEPKLIDINVREFATVYQALQCILESDYSLNEDLRSQFTELVSDINKAKEQIKKDFCIEVKKA